MKYPFAIHQDRKFSLVLICIYCTSCCFSFCLLPVCTNEKDRCSHQTFILWGCRDPGGSQTTLSLCKLCGELHTFYNQPCIHHSFFVMIFFRHVFRLNFWLIFVGIFFSGGWFFGGAFCLFVWVFF